MHTIIRWTAGFAGLLVTSAGLGAQTVWAQEGPVLLQQARITQEEAQTPDEFVLPPAPDEAGDLPPARDSAQANEQDPEARETPPQGLDPDLVPPVPEGDEQDRLEGGSPAQPENPVDPNSQNYLGVFTETVPPSLAAQFTETLGEGTGLLVTSVVSGSAAEQAGLRVNDILVRYDGEPLFVPDDLKRLVVEDEPGATVELTVIRGARPQTLPVTLGQRAVARRAIPARRALPPQTAFVPQERGPFPIGVHLPGHRSIVIDRFGLRSPWIAVDWGSPLAGRRFQAITPDGRQFEVEVRVDSNRGRWWRD